MRAKVARASRRSTRTAAASSWQARYLVDASGRDTFLANQLGVKRRNPRHNSAAIFGHFSGAERNPGERAGHISIYWFDHGWLWFIPLHDGATSVGAVVWPYYLKSRSVPLRRVLSRHHCAVPAAGPAPAPTPR